ncbi:MAG: HAD-IA family hydrolase [Clostridia bacterium]
MIKAILFDFDGVLTVDKTGSTSITNYISKKCNIPLSDVKKSYYKHNHALLKGEIVHEDMWDEFCGDLKKEISYDILIESFIETRLDEEMINIVKNLKHQYLIGLITDNKLDRIDTIFKKANLYQYFDCIAVSAELKINKESSEMFEYVSKQLQVKPNECLFIDNSEKNLVMPNSIGMKTILFDDEKRDIKNFNIILNNLLL